MTLPRGPENNQRRIQIRAEAILRGVWWAEMPDETDINPEEGAEIAAARELALKWESR
jgi:hypothetical protein